MGTSAGAAANVFILVPMSDKLSSYCSSCSVGTMITYQPFARNSQAAQKSRKMLAESTKEFRKMTDAEKVVTVKDLIRGYQEEVDSLTKRARSSDGAFFSLYKDLYEAPDPAGALKLAAAARPRAAASSLELEKLKAEVAAYEAEFKELKNQDITIRTLEEKLEDLEEAMDKQVAEQVEVVKAEIETDANRRVDEVSVAP